MVALTKKQKLGAWIAGGLLSFVVVGGYIYAGVATFLAKDAFASDDRVQVDSVSIGWWGSSISINGFSKDGVTADKITFSGHNYPVFTDDYKKIFDGVDELTLSVEDLYIPPQPEQSLHFPLKTSGKLVAKNDDKGGLIIEGNFDSNTDEMSLVVKLNRIDLHDIKNFETFDWKRVELSHLFIKDQLKQELVDYFVTERMEDEQIEDSSEALLAIKKEMIGKADQFSSFIDGRIDRVVADYIDLKPASITVDFIQPMSAYRFEKMGIAMLFGKAGDIVNIRLEGEK